MSLANAQNWAEAGVPWFSKTEESRIMAFRLPGDSKRKYGSGTYYPRRSVESPGEWFAAHRAKLRSLLRAEGMR